MKMEKMPAMGPAVGISKKERDRQIFRELLGSSGGSAQDDIFESDNEDEVDEFESEAGNSQDCEFKEGQLNSFQIVVWVRGLY